MKKLENYYHGTTKENAKSILGGNPLRHSIGNKEWLGNGFYLYKEKLYAFRWIVIKFRGKFKGQCTRKRLYTNYSMLLVKLNIENERIFSLLNAESMLEFERTKEHLKRLNKQSDKLRDSECPDGAVLNLMFEEMGYGKEYDAVEAVFFPGNRLYEMGESGRLFLAEYQLCVRNINCIGEILDVTESFDFHKCYANLNTFNNARNQSNKYKT